MIAIIIVIGATLAYIFPFAEVVGHSMKPTMYHGEILVMRRIFNHSKLKVGKIYVFKSPESEVLAIKRLTMFSEEFRQCFFEGDNPSESYDSRDYGLINAERIIAVLIWNSKHQLKKGETIK